MTPQPAESASVAVLQVIKNYWLSRAVCVAAKLGIPDLVRNGPKTLDELATATKTHAPSLRRLLRALASEGWFFEDEGDRFTATPLTAGLQTGVTGSLRALAIAELGQEHYPAWAELAYSVKTGEIAFNHVFGMANWEFWSKNPEHASIFNDAMADVTALVEPAILHSYDFSSIPKIVDVGGGKGSLISAVLAAYPAMQGILFDLPHVADAGRRQLEKAGLANRCEVVAGSFLESVPSGGDAYMLKWILHDWNDEHSVAILRNCHRAMARNGKVLLVESVIPGRNQPFLHKFMDLNMMVMNGGRERILEEYRQVLEVAGFRLGKVIQAPAELAVIEGMRA
jgi:hypothetical protein